MVGCLAEWRECTHRFAEDSFCEAHAFELLTLTSIYMYCQFVICIYLFVEISYQARFCLQISYPAILFTMIIMGRVLSFTPFCREQAKRSHCWFSCRAHNDIHVHPSTKVTQHNFDRLYLFYSAFLFIKLDIPRKHVYLPLRLMPHLFGLFHWGECRMLVGWVNWGQWQKGRELCKIYRILWEMRAMSCFVLSFCERMHSSPLRPGPFIVPRSSETKTSCWISNSDAILEH